MAVTPDGCFAISGSCDGTVRVWDLNAKKVLFILEGHTDWVYGVAITPDGRFAISASKDKTVRLWDLKTGSLLFTFEGHTDEVDGVAITDDGRFAISGSKDKTIRVWDLNAHTLISTVKGHIEKVSKVLAPPDGRIIGVAITSDGRLAICGSADNTVRVLWNLDLSESEKLDSYFELLYLKIKTDIEFIYILAGNFFMTNEGEFDLENDWILKQTFHKKELSEIYQEDYWIAKYPVTNAQYKRFIEEGGYTKKAYWSEEGWKIKQQNQYTKPRFWDDSGLNQANQPVIGISWYEAEAYCNWAEAYCNWAGLKLPTQAHYQKAARGGIWLDGDKKRQKKNELPERKYPWGNGDVNYINGWPDDSREKWYANCTTCTSPVNRYSKGSSPYGCWDMAGNVCEWSSDSKGSNRVLLGFSCWDCNHDRDHLSIGFPHHDDPTRQRLDGGFRVGSV